MEEEPRRQCVATNRSGVRCGRVPIPGGTVCPYHGGNTPQVQRAARLRLLAGADLAINYLVNMLEPREPCPTCGRSDADRDPVVVRACQLVLDRAGFHPSLTITHEQSTRRTPWSQWLLPGQLEQIADWMTEAKRRMNEGAAVPALEAHVDERPISDWLRPLTIDGETIDAPTDSTENAENAEPRAEEEL
jgi:hypothetical protein